MQKFFSRLKTVFLLGCVVFLGAAMLCAVADAQQPTAPAKSQEDVVVFHMPVKDGKLAITTHVTGGEQHVLMLPVVEGNSIVGVTLVTETQKYTIKTSNGKLTFELPGGGLIQGSEQFQIADAAGKPLFEASTNAVDPFARPVAVTTPQVSEKPESPDVDERIQEILKPKTP